MNEHQKSADEYNGLLQAEPALLSSAYHSTAAFEQEMDRIWYKSWLYVCREHDIGQFRQFRIFRTGTQEVLLVRDEAGILRAFHNTCRHRGSALKLECEGRLQSRLIVCPYHAWTYSLDGTLIRVPSKSCPSGFNKADYPLYPVAVSIWRGFVFVNLSASPDEEMEGTFDSDPKALANWPLEEMKPAHVYRKTIKCNWKIFWENFNECLHCPGVHPELSALVPIYGRGLMERRDDPDWLDHADDDAPQYSGRLRNGAETWSADGSADGRVFSSLAAEERAAGQTYVTHLPSFFVVGHADYVRSVALKPVSPEETELTAEWYFTDETLPHDVAGLENIVAFGKLVLDQDAAICEVNQRGIRSKAHGHGVLMPEEYEIARFHRWVGERVNGT